MYSVTSAMMMVRYAPRLMALAQKIASTPSASKVTSIETLKESSTPSTFRPTKTTYMAIHHTGWNPADVPKIVRARFVVLDAPRATRQDTGLECHEHTSRVLRYHAPTPEPPY